MSRHTALRAVAAVVALLAVLAALGAALAMSRTRAAQPPPRSTPTTYTVNVAGGARTSDVVDTLVASTHLTRAAVDAALENPDALGLPAEAKGRVEGYLASGTYTVTATQSATDVLAAMVSRQKDALAAAGVPGAAAGRDLSVHQLLTIASIAAAEGIPDDYAKVSRVVYNRLAKGMPLQMDSTVNYAKDTRTLRLTEKDLAEASPYNTYRHKGLPPGPISNPGPRALAAAARPANGPWLYFVLADRDGRSFFTADYQAFLKQAELSRATGVY